jgi:hypothetical protein
MTVRYAGLALIAGVILAFVAPVFMPGYALVDPVDQTDFVAAMGALGDSAVLAHWVTFISLISLLLMTFAFLALYPLASQQTGLGGKLLRFGIIVSIIEWGILIIANGMRHFVVHLMQRGDMAGSGTPSLADFESAALAVHTDMIGITLAFVALFPIASITVGLGLSHRFESMDLYKGAAYVMAAAGLVGLVNFLFAMSIPDLGVQSLLLVNNLALYVGGICFLVLGYGMYKGRAELAEA